LTLDRHFVDALVVNRARIFSIVVCALAIAACKKSETQDVAATASSSSPSSSTQTATTPSASTSNDDSASSNDADEPDDDQPADDLAEPGPDPFGLVFALDDAQLAKEAESKVEKARAELHIPGISLTVVRAGHVVVQKGYGDARLAPKTPMTEKTLLAIASETKIFTTVAVLQLVETKKIALDDAITKYVKGPTAWDTVTIHHLLAMQSGIPHRKRMPDFHDVVAWAAARPLSFSPGTKSDYSNTNFLLLGEMIESVSGQSYLDYIQKNIFAPAGITAMQLVADPMPASAALGYGKRKGANVPAPTLSATSGFSSGGLLADQIDFARFDAAMTAQKLLDKASYDAMFTPQPLADGTPGTRGLGWDSAHVVKGKRRVAQGGDLPGFKAWFARAVDEGVSVIILGNAHDKRLNAVGRAIFDDALRKK
jgi:CubicO group peptidase (beta-lactamase class C family)